MGDATRPGRVCNVGCTSEGHSDTPRRKFKKGDRTRRMWSIREEEILAATLLDLVALGWKSDNGFRAGYLQKIEDSIRVEFPNSDIKGTPHVVSKISSWKRSYSSLSAILGRTGVGFNVHGDYKIDIDDEQWEHVVQVDKDAKFMRNKPWPFWETWKCIFGRDRATGGGVEDIPVATARVRSQVAGGSQCGESAYHPSFEKFIIDDSNNVPQEPATQNNSSDNSVKYTSTTKTGSLKRKNETNDADLMHFLSNLHADTNNRLEVIAARIGYEFDLGKARQEVFEKLGEVNGLTLDQRYELCDILGDKSQRLEVFMGMPSHARLGYVMRLIHQNQKAD